MGPIIPNGSLLICKPLHEFPLNHSSGVPSRWLREAPPQPSPVAAREREDLGRGEELCFSQFTVSCLTAASAAYSCCDADLRATLSGGVLPPGHVLWISSDDEIGSNGEVLSYVRDLGLVRISGRILRRRAS